jgi:hypothetical protein
MSTSIHSRIENILKEFNGHMSQISNNTRKKIQDRIDRKIKDFDLEDNNRKIKDVFPSVDDIKDLVMDEVDDMLDEVKNGFNVALRGLEGVITIVAESVTDIFDKVKNVFIGLIDSIVGVFEDFISVLLDIRDGFVWFFGECVGDFFVKVVAWVKDKVLDVIKIVLFVWKLLGMIWDFIIALVEGDLMNLLYWIKLIVIIIVIFVVFRYFALLYVKIMTYVQEYGCCKNRFREKERDRDDLENLKDIL